MPIPYRDNDELNDLGIAGYLKIQPIKDGYGYLAALFLINARGEPIHSYIHINKDSDRLFGFSGAVNG